VLSIDFKRTYDLVRNEVFYNIVIEFGVPVKVVRLSKVCLIKHNKVRFRRFRLTQHCFNSCLLFYSDQLLYVSVVRSCIYFCLKMVVRPKHVAVNLNKIVNNY
jgi:hypothetical protein